VPDPEFDFVYTSETMGKKAKARREATAKPVEIGPPLREKPNWLLFTLSAIGMALSGYLAWTGLKGELVKGCDVGSACDVVLSSSWATLLGFPTALWGFGAYLMLAVIAFVRREDRHWQYAWIVSLFGVLYSAYLTTVSVTILNAACPYCLTSLGLMTAIFVVVTIQRPQTLTAFAWPGWLMRTALPALAVILLLHLNYTGVIGQAPAPEDPVARALADHLRNWGARFYGASWCDHCRQQKDLFGTAAFRLPYIECSPVYGQPQTAECNAQNIKTYPTWVYKDKRLEGVLTLKELADLTGFKAPTTQ
jgi:uncharacterized membrane protein